MMTLGFLESLGTPELVLIFFVLAPLLLSIIALIQCITSEFKEPTNKIVWVIVILLAPIVGSILWWILGVDQKKVQ